MTRDIAAGLRQHMDAQGRSLAELAIVLDMPDQAAGKRHNGKKALTLNELGDVAAWLGLNPYAFIGIAHAAPSPTELATVRAQAQFFKLRDAIALNPNGITHAALRKECGGPAAAVANAEQLQARIDRVRDWAARRTS